MDRTATGSAGGGDNVTVASSVPVSLQTTRLVVKSFLTPIVVTIGLFGNLLNILVLFQVRCVSTSTNVYLLVLSLADSVYLLMNIPLSQLSCSKPGLPLAVYKFNPYGRAISNFSGNVAVWVTVVFTVERYLAVCHPIHGKVWCTVHRAKLASLAATVLVFVNTLPTLFELEVVSAGIPMCVETSMARRPSYLIGYSWWYVTVFAFIPLIFLAIFNTVLIRALIVAGRKRQQLALINTGGASQTAEQNKVTLLLVTIVMIFFVCQLPWTAIYLYKNLGPRPSASGIIRLKIAGNVCNLLALVNASVNFYLYSCFSKRFRRTLAKLVFCWRRRRNMSPTNV
ncbi:hypothetical protein EGW08_005750 [Elysia chlorotica]|uniref:G-protein coupled receptors family 1 profile domain-containing protein n=1 Tax=Elysia chlorotica TaxID=188477 RepID=A0A3S1BLK7_ELYCH|nr:hypothetical protein EGW08_005750 [Elysia chlorotica]